MAQTINPVKLKAAAEHLEWVLQQYPESEEVQSLLRSLAPLMERRTGPRKVAIADSVSPASRWDPLLPGVRDTRPARDRFVRSAAAALTLTSPP